MAMVQVFEVMFSTFSVDRIVLKFINLITTTFSQIFTVAALIMKG
jgi:hypothetical protein